VIAHRRTGDHRRKLKIEAPAPWRRQPGPKLKVFWNEQTKSIASLIPMSSMPLTPGAATREIADDAIRNSTTAAHPVRPREDL
jgi:hypothetical protein